MIQPHVLTTVDNENGWYWQKYTNKTLVYGCQECNKVWDSSL